MFCGFLSIIKTWMSTMWIFFVIIAIFAFLAFCGFLFEKRDKGKSSTQLDSIKSEHNITLSFVSQAGYLAFCDTENKINNYKNALSKLEVIDLNQTDPMLFYFK